MSQIKVPNIDYSHPKNIITWDSKSDPRLVFVIALADFICAAATSNNEEDFRAKLYQMGSFVRKAKAATAGER